MEIVNISYNYVQSSKGLWFELLPVDKFEVDSFRVFFSAVYIEDLYIKVLKNLTTIIMVIF